MINLNQVIDEWKETNKGLAQYRDLIKMLDGVGYVIMLRDYFKTIELVGRLKKDYNIIDLIYELDVKENVVYFHFTRFSEDYLYTYNPITSLN